MNKNIIVSAEGRVCTITLNRPDIRNAFNAEMIGELTEAFRALQTRNDISVLVLRGEGKSFCSGADLGYMKSMAGFSLDENLADAQALDEMFWALRVCPQAVVTRVHGHAMGGALGLIAMSDIVAVVDGTQFCFSENRLGLAPAVISPYVLEKMNAGTARRYMLTAEVFSAFEALKAGLVEHVSTEVDEFIVGVVRALSENGPEAVQVTKKLLRRLGSQPDWILKRETTTRTIAEKRVSNEGQEGLRSFIEKREPSWKAGASLAAKTSGVSSAKAPK